MYEFWSSSFYLPEIIISLHMFLVLFSSFMMPCGYFHFLPPHYIHHLSPATISPFSPKMFSLIADTAYSACGCNKKPPYLLTEGKIACMSAQAKMFKGMRIFDLSYWTYKWNFTEIFFWVIRIEVLFFWH